MNEPNNPVAPVSAPPPDEGWRAQLRKLTELPAQQEPDPDHAAGDPATPLALQFEVREMISRTLDHWNGPTSRSVKPGQEPGSGEFQLGTRPALRTKRGWARGTLTWSNIGHQGGRLNLDPEQQRWFRQFFALHRAATTITVGQDASWVYLDDFVSPALWAMLKQAAELNIPLLSAGTHEPVLVHDEAQLLIDASVLGTGNRAGPDAGGMQLRPRLLLDGKQIAMRDTGVIGSHGLYLAGRGAERVVHLAPVAGGVSEQEAALLRAGSGVFAGPGAADLPARSDLPAAASAATERVSNPPLLVVPAAEHAAFLAGGLTVLRAGFTVESSDGSVVLPVPRPATAVLTVAWQRGHRLSLNWAVDTGPGQQQPRLIEVLPANLLELDALPETWIEHHDELPPSVELRGADAAEFLAKVVPELASVPGIEVRKTGKMPEYREAQGAPKLTVTRVPSATEDWFDLGVLVTVDGKTVPFAPLFRALAKGAKKLLLIDNSFLYLNHRALAPLAELIAEGQSLDEWEAGVRITRHQAAVFADFEDFEGEESSASAQWRSLVADLGREVPVPVAVPPTVRAELRPYQLRGFEWLAFLWRHRLGGILGDDMGLGKTLQCLTLMAWVKQTPTETRPFLVIAPTSVVGNWAAEAVRFTPGMKVRVRTATAAALGRPVGHDADEADILVTSYALFRLDYDQYLDIANDPDRGFAGMILDEAQFVKNARAKGNELAEQLPVAWKLAVTGTPMENSLRELHSIARIVAPGLFPSARRFEEDFVRAIERPAPGISEGRGAGSGPAAQEGLRDRRLQQLRHRLKPFMLRRTKDLVASELPLKQEQILEIELDPAHRQLYDAFLQRERQKLYGLIADLDKNRFTVFRSLTLLRMLALDASLIDEQYRDLSSAKLDALEAHALELAQEGRRALVFSQFTSFLDRARTQLHAAGIRTVTLDGSTRKRDEVIERFRRGEADVFLISLKSGGVGLNLTEADTVLLLDPWWNPASEAQAIDRSHRIGQRQPVHVVRMIALGTIEEKVLALQQRKRALFDAVVDEESLFAQALTAEDLHTLLE